MHSTFKWFLKCIHGALGHLQRTTARAHAVHGLECVRVCVCLCVCARGEREVGAAARGGSVAHHLDDEVGVGPRGTATQEVRRLKRYGDSRGTATHAVLGPRGALEPTGSNTLYYRRMDMLVAHRPLSLLQAHG